MFGLSTIKLMGVTSILTLALVAWPAIELHNWRVDNLEEAWVEKRKAAVKAVKEELEAICAKNNMITKERGDELQARLTVINDRYYSLLKRATTGGNCSLTIAGAASGSNGETFGDVPAMLLPISAAKRADEQAAKLITLQDVVADIYKNNDQIHLLPTDYQK